MSEQGNRIPCTVEILTHNSDKTLLRALESVEDFAEIIVIDGGSTDSTRTIAEARGVGILDQDAKFLSPEGRIADFSGVRNQGLNAAREPWFLFLDSDEYLSAELAEEIRSATLSHAADAYRVPRLYERAGAVITCASTYPNFQMRLFRKEAARRFIKEVHERIELTPEARIGQLVAPIIVPFDATPAELKEKWRRYIAIEVARRRHMTYGEWIQGAWRHLLVSGLYVWRLLRNTVLCRGRRMPLSLELLRHWYHYALYRALWRITR